MTPVTRYYPVFNLDQTDGMDPVKLLGGEGSGSLRSAGRRALDRDDGAHKNAFVTFRKRGWHRIEPGKQVASEEPIRFRQLVLRAMAEGVISRERAE